MSKIETSQEDINEFITINDRICSLLGTILRREFPIGTKFKSHLVDARDLPECLDWKWQVTGHNVTEWQHYNIEHFRIQTLFDSCIIEYKTLDTLGRPNGPSLWMNVRDFKKMHMEW